ncbi:MAG: hypothetical protein FWB72_01705 [Firmicutes bacterium]|nr:hypothetical protein [Bacillota bacterium]
MRYFPIAFAYIRDNFGRLFLLSVPLGVVLAFALNHLAFFDWLVNYQPADEASFSRVWSNTSWLVLDYWYILLGAAALFIIFGALAIGYIDKHMRLGIFELAKPPSRFIDCLIAICLITIVLVALLLVWQLLVASLLFLIETFLSAEFLVYIKAGVAGLMILILLYVISLFLFWVPTMLTSGYQANPALAYGLKAMRGRSFRILFNILIITLVVYGVNVGLHFALYYMEVNYAAVEIALKSIVYTFVVIYFIAFSFTAFYNATNKERVDLIDIRNLGYRI